MKTFKNWSKELALVTNFTGEKVNPTEYQQGDRAAGTTAGTTRTMKIAHSIGRSYGTIQDCKEVSYDYEVPLAYSIQRCRRVL